MCIVVQCAIQSSFEKERSMYNFEPREESNEIVNKELYLRAKDRAKFA
jgi:hypothetical protein